MTARGPRVVLDTNAVISALVFGSGPCARLRRAWQQGRFVPLVCTETVSELLRVLAYPKFGLSPSEREELLADFLPWCETAAGLASAASLPPCRDPADLRFLQLAVMAKADYLVSGDADLLGLSSAFSRPILAVSSFLTLLDPP